MIPVPTPRLAIAAALASLLVLLAPGSQSVALVIVDGALLALALLDVALAPSPAAVAVDREPPAVVPLGREAPLRWRVVNPTTRRLHARIADELAPSLGAASRRAAVDVPRRGRVVAATTIRPTRRGRFDVAELTVRVDGPMRLASRQQRRRVPDTIRVYPPFASRDEAELRIDKARILDVGLRSAKGQGGATDFDQLRDYNVDDDSRRIDWAATARAGKAIVRTYRAERNQTVLSLLDCGRTMAGQVAGVPRLEHAMDAVMMLTAVASRLGDRAGLVAFDQQVRAIVPPGHGRDQLGRVTEAMYTVDPELVESDYHGAFVQTLTRFRRRALLVVFTELAEQAMAETLLPALPLVARDNIVVIVSARDPQVLAWSRAMPSDASEAFRKAAAAGALAERRRITAKLRGSGATVVDAAPGELAPRLADVYLRVKASGRL